MDSRQVLITGASSDIGLALCHRYLQAGWRVVAHYRTLRPELEALAGDRLTPWRCDFANTDALESELTRPQPFDACDALVNLAAVVRPVSFATFSASDLLQMVAVNTLPSLILMRRLGPGMVSRGFGRIIQGSSIGVKFGGGSDLFCYSFSKHALEFIPATVRSWAAANVFVNVVRIGVTDNRHLCTHVLHKNISERVALIPARRPAQPEEIAETLFWLGSEANGYTSGQVIAAAGGE